jgi:hypothetical protein
MNITIPTIAAVSAALILAPSARAPSPVICHGDGTTG